VGHLSSGERVKCKGEMVIGREVDEWRTGVREREVEREREM
jgi:hypothetical protein